MNSIVVSSISDPLPFSSNNLFAAVQIPEISVLCPQYAQYDEFYSRATQQKLLVNDNRVSNYIDYLHHLCNVAVFDCTNAIIAYF